MKIKEVLVRLNKAHAVGYFPLKGNVGDRLVALFALFGDDSIDAIEQPVFSSISTELIPGLSEMTPKQRLVLAQKVYELAKKNLVSGGSLDGRPITQEYFSAMNHLRKEIAETRALLEGDDLGPEPQALEAGSQTGVANRLSWPCAMLNRLSYKGKVWRTIINGEEHKLTCLTPETGDTVPMQMVNLVVLEHNKAHSRAYYEGSFGEDEAHVPRCASCDGVRPNADIQDPCAATCAACSNSVKGSKVTANGKQTTLCQANKRIAVVPSANIGTLPPMLLLITQTSVWDKDNPHEAQGWYAWDQYLDMLRSRGAKHTAAVETCVRFDPDQEYPKLQFSARRWLSSEEAMAAKTLLTDKADGIDKIITGVSTTGQLNR
ncbi:hypothetical protein [Vogesella indigofera]|uniref:hypothetical protein n=1 Tax=Vogesella indigofera TaxID=45465 RepID=UPI003F4222FE